MGWTGAISEHVCGCKNMVWYGHAVWSLSLSLEALVSSGGITNLIKLSNAYSQLVEMAQCLNRITCQVFLIAVFAFYVFLRYQVHNVLGPKIRQLSACVLDFFNRMLGKFLEVNYNPNIRPKNTLPKPAAWRTLVEPTLGLHAL